MRNVIKFVNWNVPDIETHRYAMCYKVMEKLNLGKTLTADDKQWIEDHVNHLTGTYRVKGWEYNFKPHLKRFWIKTYTGELYEVFGLNKTSIRRIITGVIREVVEMKGVK